MVVKRAGAWVTALVGIGPLVSMWWLSAQTDTWGAANVAVAAWVLWFFWTPLAPFTFTAVVLGDQRDAALPDLHGRWLVRTVLLVPWLALADTSRARGATLANLTSSVALLYWLLITNDVLS